MELPSSASKSARLKLKRLISLDVDVNRVCLQWWQQQWLHQWLHWQRWQHACRNVCQEQSCVQKPQGSLTKMNHWQQENAPSSLVYVVTSPLTYLASLIISPRVTDPCLVNGIFLLQQPAASKTFLSLYSLVHTFHSFQECLDTLLMRSISFSWEKCASRVLENKTLDENVILRLLDGYGLIWPCGKTCGVALVVN